MLVIECMWRSSCIDVLLSRRMYVDVSNVISSRNVLFMSIGGQ